MSSPAHPLPNTPALPDGIAVITINWNGWRHTLNCLASLRRSEGPPWHLYIVDNASTDDSLAHLTDLGEDVTLIRSPVNGGWTGGNNLGLRHALDAGHQRFFLLNNDAAVRPDTLARLTDVLAAFGDDQPLLGPVHRTFDDDGYNFVGAKLDERSGLPVQDPPWNLRHEQLPELRESAYIRGAALLMTRAHLERIGGFDDAFYLNYDETDWCFRARKLGIGAVMVRDAVILHLECAALGGADSPLNLYFKTRNLMLFAERHCTTRQRLSALLKIMRQTRNFCGKRPSWPLSLLVGRSSTMVAMRSGLRDYALRRFGDCPARIRQLR
jgi:GT2 family glycosyltransferase